MLSLNRLDIGVLNFGFYNPINRNVNLVIADMIRMAIELEQSGYRRYWIGEHYGILSAWRNTEILIATLCGLTDRMRIGAGGVLLKVHDSMHVAHNFKMLENLFPGRIDLGIAAGLPPIEILRAYGTSSIESNQMFPKKVAELVASIRQNDVSKNGTQQGNNPSIWMLGSESSANLAVKYGTKFCLSLMHSNRSMEAQKEVLSTFTKQYKDAHGHDPEIAIAVAGVCSSHHDIAIKTANDIKRTPYSQIARVNVYGKEETCKEQLEILAHEFECKQIFLLDICDSFELKLQTYALLANAFNFKQLS